MYMSRAVTMVVAGAWLLSGCDASTSKPQHWRQVGELGGSPVVRIVEVNAASAHDGAVYRQAAQAVCGTGSDCWQMGVFLPGDPIPSGDKANFFRDGGWGRYAPAAVWTGGEFTKWDCDKAGVEGAPASALCGAGAKEQLDAAYSLGTRVAWTTACGLPPTKDEALVDRFIASMKDQSRATQLHQAFDEMKNAGGPDDSADCLSLRPRIEKRAKIARRELNS